MWTSNQGNARQLPSKPLPGDNNFDFASWAQLVRQQMMLSLEKRRREA
ncbi:MAG: hypothetical protein AAGA75_00765 [Cyanobacteria bacterium P01_E01_bin.6]